MKMFILSCCMILCCNSAVFANQAYRYGVSKGDKVNIRINPDIKSVAIDMLNKGDVAVVLAKSAKTSVIEGEEYHWYKILSIRKKRGWVFGKYLHEVKDDGSFENNIYRSFLHSDRKLKEKIESRITFERFRITIDRENLLCVLENITYPPKDSHYLDWGGGIYFYEISPEGKILFKVIDDYGCNFYITKTNVYVWHETIIKVYDRLKYGKAYMADPFPVRRYSRIFRYGTPYEPEKYDSKKSFITFDPSTFILTVYLYPVKSGKPIVQKYRYADRKLKLLNEKEQ